MPLRKRHVMYVGVSVVVVAVSVGLGMVYCGISTSLTAERALHANLLVVDLVREYVVDHQGAWPRSWQDLERLPPRQRGMYQWPEDGDTVWRYVSVDFGADPEKLATEPLERFTAIQPKGPCYPYEHYPELANLLDAVRRSRRGDRGTTPQ